MANPFDQFDQAETAPQIAANPFDQFDKPPTESQELEAKVRAFKERNVQPLKEQAAVTQRVESGKRFLQQQDTGVDYSGVPDIKNRSIYSLLSPKEKLRFLQQAYGAGNVSQDSFGRPVINIGGKRVSFLPRGQETHPLASYADVAGDVLPVAGMIAGGVAGAPGGIPASLALAGGGGAAGEAVNKLIKQGLGLNLQSSEETAKDIVLQGATGVGAEGAGQLLRLAGRSGLAPYAERSIFGPNEAAKPAYRAQMADVGEAIDMGLTPRVGAFAPNAPLVQRAQNAGFRLFGDPLGLKNRPVIETGRQRLAGKVGAAGEMTPEAIARTGERINPQLARSADTAIQAAEQRATAATADASKLLKDAETRITQSVGQPKGGLAASVNENIRATKDAFRTKASELYAPVDAMAGKPIVPTEGIKREMQTIIAEGPQTVEGKALLASDAIKAFAKDIAALPEHVTFQQMQIARSTLRDKSALDALNAGLSERQAARLANAADGAFTDANKLFIPGSAMPADINKAIKALRRADAYYSAGMKRFNDLSVEALVKDATQSGFIQPEKVAQFIAAPGQTDKLLRIKKVVKPETFAEVGREKWAQLVGASTDSLTADVSGKKLADRLVQMGDSLDVLYGPQQAMAMRNLSKQLAALDGKIAPEALQGGNIKDAIRKAVDSELEFKRVASANHLTMIRDGGPQSMKAADWLTQPENRVKLKAVISQFGPDSVEAKSLKEYLARKILTSMEVPSSAVESKFGATVLRGEPLQKELAKYGRPYLEEVFGKEWSNQVHAFARRVEIGTRYNPQDSGGLAAAAMGLHPFKNLFDLAHFYSIGWATTKSPMINFMMKGVPGVRDQSALMNALREAAAQSTRAYIDWQAERLPKQGSDYVQGAATRLQTEAQKTQQPSQTLRGINATMPPPRTGPVPPRTTSSFVRG